MSRISLSHFVPHLAGAVIGLTVGALTLPMPTFLLWNASASVPLGLYGINPLRAPVVGDMVAVAPPPALGQFMAERHYLPLGVPLLKHIAARPGAVVCRQGATVTIHGRSVAVAKFADSHGRPLPVWRGCRVLERDELFLLNASSDSFDGRYFGPIPATGLIGRAIPFLTRDTPQAPLRWRFGCARSAQSTHLKEETHADRLL
ncbi:conjugative transfer signal peptidase TraF [Novosphingobium hassiacum]|uniref:Conjugative transfer signal peptidase TraF n=1 Tax=Novosphingobium hassiacum TaxID=173676 RepID=A0A7W5ZZ81_9SPHN|nr:S26 family signal peptidase [Novosphingobium hassiacum]MBB3862746.1 conjugative transfer signal peptidase TraF [Novosphingobium hassiacum]